jgi:hypothetical protein
MTPLILRRHRKPSEEKPRSYPPDRGARLRSSTVDAQRYDDGNPPLLWRSHHDESSDPTRGPTPNCPIPCGRAPPRVATRPLLQFQRLGAAPRRRGCNAGRWGFCANSAFGSKFARAMLWFPHRGTPAYIDATTRVMLCPKTRKPRPYPPNKERGPQLLPTLRYNDANPPLL